MNLAQVKCYKCGTNESLLAWSDVWWAWLCGQCRTALDEGAK